MDRRNISIPLRLLSKLIDLKENEYVHDACWQMEYPEAVLCIGIEKYENTN